MNKTVRFRGGRRRKSKASRRIKHVKRTARRTGRRIGRRTKHRNSKRRNKSRKRHMRGGWRLGQSAKPEMPKPEDYITLTEKDKNNNTVHRLGQVIKITPPNWLWDKTTYAINFNDGKAPRDMYLHNKQFTIVDKKKGAAEEEEELARLASSSSSSSSASSPEGMQTRFNLDSVAGREANAKAEEDSAKHEQIMRDNPGALSMTPVQSSNTIGRS